MIRPVVPVLVAMTVLDLTDDAAAGLSCALIGVSGRMHSALFGTRGVWVHFIEHRDESLDDSILTTFR